MINLIEMTQSARQAAKSLALMDRGRKDEALQALADWLETQTDPVLKANAADIDMAKGMGLAPALVDRLRLSEASLRALAADVRHVAQLRDPVGCVFDRKMLPNGLQVHKQRVPLGVLAVIYESRPNVTVEAASLCLKSGNATILRGGSEALASNCAIARCLATGLQAAGLPETAVQG